MLTIGDYYYNLFLYYHPSRVLTLVHQPFAFGTMTILAYNESKINTRGRNIFGYSLFFASSFMLIVVKLTTPIFAYSIHLVILLVEINLYFSLIVGFSHIREGGLGSFIGICAFVASFGVADACVQGGVVGDLSFMLPEFIQSFFAGLAASGSVTSALRLITKAAFEKGQVLLFLAISTFFEFLCLVLYTYYFPKLPIVKYFRSKAASEGTKTVKADLVAAGIQTKDDLLEDSASQVERLSNKQLFLQNVDYALDLYLIYVLMLSIFPGFLYENTGEHQLGTWYPLVLIAAYNI
ncbi:hypothetical protein GQ457_05G029680 [Hibiscus cannabinus]